MPFEVAGKGGRLPDSPEEGTKVDAWVVPLPELEGNAELLSEITVPAVPVPEDSGSVPLDVAGKGG